MVTPFSLVYRILLTQLSNINSMKLLALSYLQKPNQKMQRRFRAIKTDTEEFVTTRDKSD